MKLTEISSAIADTFIDWFTPTGIITVHSKSKLTTGEVDLISKEFDRAFNAGLGPGTMWDYAPLFPPPVKFIKPKERKCAYCGSLKQSNSCFGCGATLDANKP